MAAAPRYLERAARVTAIGARAGGQPPRVDLSLLRGVEADLDELAVIVTLERRARRRVEQRDHVGVVVGDRVHVVQADVGKIVDVRVALEAAQEAPAAVEVGIRLLAIHEADGAPVDGDVIAREARATAPRERPDLVGGELVSFGQDSTIALVVLAPDASSDVR